MARNMNLHVGMLDSLLQEGVSGLLPCFEKASEAGSKLIIASKPATLGGPRNTHLVFGFVKRETSRTGDAMIRVDGASDIGYDMIMS